MDARTCTIGNFGYPVPGDSDPVSYTHLDVYKRQAKTCGENVDRWDLGLYGLQQELVERVAATGTPTVVVLINGRPLALPWIKAHIPAVVEAWEPGCMGGQAVAEMLAGKVNPSGKLPMRCV